jgi:hypothetical protein
MGTINIFWTNTAYKQLNFVFEYWNKRNKSNLYSRKLFIKVFERIEILKTNPNIGKKTDFKDTRIISMGHYSNLYKNRTNEIIITGFWDNRQNPGKLLKFLK